MNIPKVNLPDEVLVEVIDLAIRHQNASSGGIEIINALGGQAESWMDALPPSITDGLNSATQAALRQAVRAASASRRQVPDQPDWVNAALTTVMGAAGGFGGAATALAELPVTTTLLLRVIQGVAESHGFDPTEESVQFDCLTVFASAGPLADDDGAETAFLSVRMGLTGGAMQTLIGVVAPRLASALGQKLAAQAVPVIGAAAGAAINYQYTNYYREMAHVVFGLRKLAIDYDIPEQVLIEAFRQEIKPTAVVVKT